MRGYKVMNGYKGKVAGMAIAGVGLVALVTEKFTHTIVLQKMNWEQHYNILLWFTIFGLFNMAFSFEKVEDERVKQIRAKAMAIALLVQSASILAFGFALSISAQKDGMDKEVMDAAAIIEWGRLLMFFPAVSIIAYLLLFHIGLYFDQLWDYSENITYRENFRKNFVHMLVIAITGVALVMVVSTFFM